MAWSLLMATPKKLIRDASKRYWEQKKQTKLKDYNKTKQNETEIKQNDA